MTGDELRLLGQDAGGCTVACSEMHTFTWPCEQAVVPDPQEAPMILSRTRLVLLIAAVSLLSSVLTAMVLDDGPDLSCDIHRDASGVPTDLDCEMP